MAEGNGGGIGPIVLIGGAAVAYLYWPQIAAALGISTTSAATSAAPSTTAPAGAQMTNSSPTINTPGSVAVGSEGCFIYNNMISCPPGVSPPPAAAPINNCQPGFSVDASGVCTLYSDAALLAGLNSIQWSGVNNIPAEQISRIDPQILAQYGSTTGVNPGSVLAYMLGLGGSAAAGTVETGSDGNMYTMTNGVWARSAGSGTIQGLGRIGRLGALPVTNKMLVQASHDPATAAILGNNPAALLTVPQWNYFYTQASGVVQTGPTHPSGEPGSRVNAQTYQQLRAAAGLPVRLGTIRKSAPGAFPLGGLGTVRQGPMRVPYITPGNRTIYRVPGRGAVLGVIHAGGGNHRWSRSPFPRKADWRRAE